MKKFLFCLILLFGVNIAAAESIITVNVNNSTDAVWVMEKIIPLTNSELIEWESLIQTGQNFSRYKNIPEYEDLFITFQNFSSSFSNRSMEVESFNITYETKKLLSDGQGIIKYTFLWKNFSTRDSKKIFIGDAFPGGVFLLSPDNQLRVMIPDGYDVANVTPVFDKRNENFLVWDGTLSNNFSAGQPLIVLSPANKSNVSNVSNAITVIDSTGWKWLIVEGIILFIVFIAFVAFYRYWKNKRLEKVSTSKIEFYKDMITDVPNEMLNEISEIPEFWKKLVQSVQKEHGTESLEELEKAAREQRLKNIGLDPGIPRSDLDIEDLDDEEMILKFLLIKGGQAYQSDIVEHSGLSKSKISMVLSKMKGDGKILKIRKGKENLIRIAKPQNGTDES